MDPGGGVKLAPGKRRHYNLLTTAEARSISSCDAEDLGGGDWRRRIAPQCKSLESRRAGCARPRRGHGRRRDCIVGKIVGQASLPIACPEEPRGDEWDDARTSPLAPPSCLDSPHANGSMRALKN